MPSSRFVLLASDNPKNDSVARAKASVQLIAESVVNDE
jgi:hypothetical protein